MVSSMPKDNHSLMQLYLDGPKNCFFTFFDVNDHSGQKVKNSQLLNSFNYLKNKKEIFFQTSEDFGDFESAADEDITGGGTNAQDALDTDGDGIPDTLETSQYGTLPNNPDTDGDGMSDGWEIANGLNPNDNGLSDVETNDPSQADTDVAEIAEEWN